MRDAIYTCSKREETSMMENEELNTIVFRNVLVLSIEFPETDLQDAGKYAKAVKDATLMCQRFHKSIHGFVLGSCRIFQIL